jgi:TrmH family RNA methyltransferase
MKVNITTLLENSSLHISSLDNKIVKLLKKMIVQPSQYPEFCVVEGQKNIMELYSSDLVSLQKLFILESTFYSLTHDVQDMMRERVIFVSQAILYYLTDLESNTGMIGLFSLKYSLADYSLLGDMGPTYILDGIQDPGNLGTLLRTAAALGRKNIILIGGVFPFHQKVIRSSAGLIAKIRIVYFKSRVLIPEDFIKTRNIVLLDIDGVPISFSHVGRYTNSFFVLGNEGAGIHQYWKDCGCLCVSLEMAPVVESLNVAVAGSIVGYVMWGIAK